MLGDDSVVEPHQGATINLVRTSGGTSSGGNHYLGEDSVVEPHQRAAVSLVRTQWRKPHQGAAIVVIIRPM